MAPRTKGRTDAPRFRSNVNQIFNNYNFAILGNFGRQRTHTDIERWIRHHGGTVHKAVSDQTHYLICTTFEYKKKQKADILRAALNNAKTCTIVTFGWLEDCCMKRNNKGKLISTKEFELRKTTSRARAASLRHAGNSQGYATEGNQFKELVDPYRYTINFDAENFRQKIRLTRLSSKVVLKKDKSGDTATIQQVERHDLYIFKSNAFPHLYQFGEKYSKPSHPAVYTRTHCLDMFEHDAFAAFRQRFKKLTQIEWDDRLKGLKGDAQAFIYTPPSGGMPVGVLPAKYVGVWSGSEEAAELIGDAEAADAARETGSFDATGGIYGGDTFLASNADGVLLCGREDEIGVEMDEDSGYRNDGDDHDDGDEGEGDETDGHADDCDRRLGVDAFKVAAEAGGQTATGQALISPLM